MLFGPTTSVRDWYRENSGNRLNIVRAGVLGWFDADKPADHYWSHPPDAADGFLDGHVEKWTEAIRKADPYFNFANYDTNGNRVLESNELAVVIVIPQAGPFGTIRAPAAREWPTWQPLVVDGVTIPLIAEWYTGNPNLGVINHELGHLLLGAPDMYHDGPWPYAAGLYSIMDDSYSTTHLDPFLKLKLGWLTYTVPTTSGEYTLRDVETSGQALILYDPYRGPGEYFLIENRWRGSSYDAGRGAAGVGLPADGLAVWHILEDPALFPLVNPPPPGGATDWGRVGVRMIRTNGGTPLDDSQALFRTAGARLSDETSPARLRWLDGTRTGFEIELVTGPGSAGAPPDRPVHPVGSRARPRRRAHLRPGRRVLESESTGYLLPRPEQLAAAPGLDRHGVDRGI